MCKTHKTVHVCLNYIIRTAPTFKRLLLEYGLCTSHENVWIIKYVSQEHKLCVFIPFLRTQVLCNNAHISECNGQWLEEVNPCGEGVLNGGKISYEALKKEKDMELFTIQFKRQVDLFSSNISNSKTSILMS